MAKVTIHSYDGITKTEGMPKLLKSYCEYDTNTALDITDQLKKGSSVVVEISFPKIEEFTWAAQLRGFKVSV